MISSINVIKSAKFEIKMIFGLWLFFLFSASVVGYSLAGAFNNHTFNTQKVSIDTKLCLGHGGKSEIRQTTTGKQQKVCVLPSGKVVDERALSLPLSLVF